MATTPATDDHPRGRLDKRKAILDAAFDVFAERGYDQAGVDEIAARAGVAKGTIYNHFGDKKNLLRQTIAIESDQALAKNMAVVEQLSGRPADLRAALRQVGHELLVCHFEDRSVRFRRLMASEITQFPELLDIMRGRAADRVMDALADRLARLALDGRLHIADAEIAADQFWALLVGPAEARSRMGTRRVSDDELETVTESAVDTFLSAFHQPDADT